jgi:hypothetical protein
MDGMATLQQKVKCERKMRSIIEASGLPEPDEVEYGYTCIWVIWNEPKVALRIDIDEDPDLDYESQLTARLAGN